MRLLNAATVNASKLALSCLKPCEDVLLARPSIVHTGHATWRLNLNLWAQVVVIT